MPNPLTALEAYAAIPLAAVCCDQNFSSDEARVIREQLLERSSYREMEPYAFGVLISHLLKRFREESWQGLIEAAAPQLRDGHREEAFALACQIIYCDRDVSIEEQQFLVALADRMNLPSQRAEQTWQVCKLLSRDF
jgi:hypothetical protein